MKFVLLHDSPNSPWAWELRSDATDELLARSSQSYVKRADAVASINAVQQHVPEALAYDEAGLILIQRG